MFGAGKTDHNTNSFLTVEPEQSQNGVTLEQSLQRPHMQLEEAPFWVHSASKEFLPREKYLYGCFVLWTGNHHLADSSLRGEARSNEKVVGPPGRHIMDKGVVNSLETEKSQNRHSPSRTNNKDVGGIITGQSDGGRLIISNWLTEIRAVWHSSPGCNCHLTFNICCWVIERGNIMKN